MSFVWKKLGLYTGQYGITDLEYGLIILPFLTCYDSPVAQFGAAYQAVGLDTMSYVPTSTPVAYNAWPTLQELISSGKRVVSFMDYNADYSSVNYILDHCEFSPHSPIHFPSPSSVFDFLREESRVPC